MIVDVVFLPGDLRAEHLSGRAVAVFDVLRATTTMAAALAAGVAAIGVYGDVPAVRAAARAVAEVPSVGLMAAPVGPLLCGEERCLRPDGFDLGNSPGAFGGVAHAGRTVLMSTTNGTKAILASRGAAVRVAAAVVNASAVARVLLDARLDVTLLCAGTGGQIAMEDVLGCGAVIESLRSAGGDVSLARDTARLAHRLFADNRHRLAEVMADAEGGRNVTAAGLAEDIAFAARLDALDVVGVVRDDDHGVPTVRAWVGASG
jgi:2-phosphosulfolactate phosphatase